MLFRTVLFFYVIGIFCTGIFAQDLGAYTDYMGHFYIFDKGKSIRVEDLDARSFKIGGECVLYTNASGELKLYYKGEVRFLEKGVSEYIATDCLAVYNVFERLEVIWKGRIYNVSYRCTSYHAEDSLVAFYDKIEESLRVFYKGKTYDIESGLLGNPIQKWESGDNIIAYISENTHDFNIWYQGESRLIQNNISSIKFKAGRDIVAYVDETDKTFKAFYKGNIVELESFEPLSFKVGDGFVVYVTSSGEFKVFSGSEPEIINSFTPEDYFTEDNILVFIQDNYFKAWYNNEVVEIESFVPSVYKMDWNTIAYIDNSSRFWIFKDGEKKYLSNEFVKSFDLVRDLILMNVKVDRNIIYYKGTYFNGE